MSQHMELSAPIGRAWMRVAQGTVIHQQAQRWSETSVHTTGGEHIVTPFGGHTFTPLRVHSSTSTHEAFELWVREKGVEDHHVTLYDSSFRAAPGQTVRLAWAGNAKRSNGNYVFVENVNSGHIGDAMHGWWLYWLKREGLYRLPLLYRASIRWVPALAAMLLLFLFLPISIEAHNTGGDWNGAFVAELEGIARTPSVDKAVALSKAALAQWSPHILKESFLSNPLAYLLASVALATVYAVIQLVGHLVFGYWWSLWRTLSFRNRLLKAFRASKS